MSLKSDVVCQSYGNVYSVMVFSWMDTVYIFCLMLFSRYRHTATYTVFVEHWL